MKLCGIQQSTVIVAVNHILHPTSPQTIGTINTTIRSTVKHNRRRDYQKQSIRLGRGRNANRCDIAVDAARSKRCEQDVWHCDFSKTIEMVWGYTFHLSTVKKPIFILLIPVYDVTVSTLPNTSEKQHFWVRLPKFLFIRRKAELYLWLLCH